MKSRYQKNYNHIYSKRCTFLFSWIALWDLNQTFCFSHLKFQFDYDDKSSSSHSNNFSCKITRKHRYNNKRLKIHSNGFLFKMFHSLDDQLWQNSRLFFLLFGSCFSFWNHSEYLFRYFIQLSFYLVQNRVDLSLVIQVDLKMKRKIELMIKLITKTIRSYK